MKSQVVGKILSLLYIGIIPPNHIATDKTIVGRGGENCASIWQIKI